MVKPPTLYGYSDGYAMDCERVLVKLGLRELGPWNHRSCHRYMMRIPVTLS